MSGRDPVLQRDGDGTIQTAQFVRTKYAGELNSRMRHVTLRSTRSAAWRSSRWGCGWRRGHWGASDHANGLDPSRITGEPRINEVWEAIQQP